MKDGWHKINGNDVLVEAGRVIRGRKDGRTTYPYRYYTKYGWTKEAFVASSLYNNNFIMA